MIKLRATYLLLLGIAVIVVIAGLQLRERLAIPDAIPMPPLVVETVQITPSPFVVTAGYSGTIEAQRRAMIASRLASTVSAISVREGDVVEQKQLLLSLDDAEQRQELQRLNAAADRIRADLKYWRGQLKIDQNLFAKGTISEQKLQETARQVATLSASLEENSHARATAETRLGYAEVVAPFPGIVQSVPVNEGEAVNPGSPLVELVDTKTLKAVISAPQADQQQLSPGLPVYLHLHRMTTSWQGEIGHIYPALDSRSRNLTFDVPLDNGTDLPLHVGMSVEAVVELEKFDDAISVPLQAVQQRRGDEGVFAIREGRAVWLPVKTGKIQDGRVQILDGIKVDERVISTPYPTLEEGTRVQRYQEEKEGQTASSEE
ncbi:MAG: efflux RND transporter periplasmic adaptor subunit [Gammaproteobacteria bacterium]|nr:efflux RND transporter periplasmic adaptor subunit [Gammaproteobacteria bacterium]